MVILLNKPFKVLCQFSDDRGRATLADYVDTPDVYPAGRLDFDSEGLVVLTDDGSLQARITHPRFKLPKIYWAQVEGVPTDKSLYLLQRGVILDGRKTLPARVRQIPEPGRLWPRQPPIRYRKTVPDAWLEIELSEGRNRQVRRMTAAVGLPTLRLIRTCVGPWRLADLAPGESRTETAPDWLLERPGPRRSRRFRRRS